MESNEYTENKKRIARECIVALKSKEGLYDETQVMVACMSAIDKWQKN